MKNNSLLLIIWLLVFGICLSGYAQDEETLTLLTYYPAPYGVYNDLRVFGSNGLTIRYWPANDTTQGLTRLHLIGRGTGGTEREWTLYTAAVGGGWGVNPNAFEIWEYPTTQSRFQIRPGGNTILVPSGGSVGIGTTDPGSYKLNVIGDIKATLYHGDIYQDLRLTQPGRIRANGSLLFVADDNNDDTGTNIIFYYNGEAEANIKYIMKEDGRMGIGTSNPQTGLQINTNITESPVVPLASADSVKLGMIAGRPSISLEKNGYIKWRIDTFSGDFRIGKSGTMDQFFIDTQTNRVGLGTVSPGYRLDVVGVCHATEHLNSSDIRFKTNVEPLTNVLEKLDKIRGVSFDWNELYSSMGRSTGHREIGVIGQELETVFPELVSFWGNENYRAVNYDRLTAVLLEAIKELKEKNEILEQKVEMLEKKLSSSR